MENTVQRIRTTQAKAKVTERSGTRTVTYSMAEQT